MLKASELVESNSVWLLGSGNIHITKDRRLPNVPDNIEDRVVKEEFYPDGKPNVEIIYAICGPGVMNEINKKRIHLTGGNDKLVWTLAPNSEFSFSSAWNLVRQKQTQNMIGKYGWHPHVPIKVSFFLWRVMKQAIPTDRSIQ